VGAITQWLRRQVAEGAWRMAYGSSIETGRLFDIPFGNGWERGLKLAAGPTDGRAVPAAFACVMASARATSQCYPAHKRINPAGKHETVTTSPASRLLRNPNGYQTFDLFLFNIVASMGFDGEALALVVRDDRGAPVELHQVPKGSFRPFVDPLSGAIFYAVAEHPQGLYRIAAGYELVPARDVIHFRQYTPRHPLIGETALCAAALATGINVALSASQAAFFANAARPAGILSTDQSLSKDQMIRLREAFEAQSAGLAQGKLPILGNGLKFQPLAINSVDAQLIEVQRMSVEDIARVFGVPLPIIGDLSKATLNNTEQLVNLWLSVSLGSLIEALERTFDRAFQFERSDYVELDTNALLRTDLAARIDAFAKGIQGGVYAPNEAREIEGLDPKPGGDVPYLQAQMTPLDMLGAIAEKAAEPTPPPAPPAPPAEPPPPADKGMAELAEALKLIAKRASEPPPAPPPFDRTAAAELLGARLRRKESADA
jgi:HK97 family phage portal protein